MTRTCLFALIMCLVRSAGAAPSSPELAEAKRHFDSGAMFYDAGKYQAAREEFLEAYRLSQHPDLLYNLAQVSRHLGDDQKAISYLETYLKERPAVRDRGKIEREIEQLRQKEAGRDTAAQVPAPQPPPVAPAPRRAPSRVPPWPAVGLMAGGAASLIIGIGLGGGALATAREVEAASPRYDAALDQKGRSLSAAAITFDVIGVAVLGAGVAWTGVWLYRRHKLPRSSTGSY